MTHALLTTLRLWIFFGALMTFPPACQPIPEKVVAPPPPQINEVARTLCLIWQRTAPTWADEDTELTKDQIDYSIRSREEACRGYN